jgi:glycine dehydrogenase subunit 1
VAGVPPAFAGPFAREVALRLPVPAADAVEAGRQRGFLLGVDLGAFDPGWRDLLLVAATEKRTKDEIDRWAEALAASIGGGAR